MMLPRDPSVNVAGKRVAVIGNGSSGVQVLPQLQKTAAQLTNYIRSPTWIFANYASELTKDGSNFAFTEDEKKKFRDDPDSLWRFRKEIENRYVKPPPVTPHLNLLSVVVT
jgi:cation diffusion facilitator CzcD-associated flavoprotein CzcO